MKNWWKRLNGKVKAREPLKKHTTFKIGGPARLFIEPRDIADLKVLINALKRYRIPLLVIGAGSNILVSDSGINAVVVRLASPYFRRCSFKKELLEVGAGCKLSRTIADACNRGLSGIEFLSGIPGTIGGALAMNAGAWGSSISDKVLDVRVMDYNGRIKDLGREEIEFLYRNSSLRKYIILSCRLQLQEDKCSAIKTRIEKYLKERKERQDLSAASAGCVFKNPPGAQAGRLIDSCGLKGKRVGGAEVSLKHANFILNKDHATAADVLSLINLIRKTAQQKCNITLEPEIEIWK